MGRSETGSKNEIAKKDALGKALGKYSRVNEFLADFVEAAKGLDILEDLKQASPWADALGNALGDAIPPVRFVLKLFEGLTKVDDPHELGYLAATLAYHRAVEQAWLAMPAEARARLASADPQLRKKALAELRAASPPESYDFSRFSFDRALECDFFRDAERFLAMSTEGLGLDEPSFLQLQHGVRIRFVPNLKGILSHGATRDKFAPFRELLTLDSSEARAYDALLEHADYQRWLFEEQKVLGSEPFTLAQIYTETDCGVLRWEECNKKKEPRSEREEPVDPFKEKFGGRHSLIETVLGLIADPGFKDAIVIQGVAGSGKSSATLRLAWELVRQGLRPIRVELKHLDVSDSMPIDEALPRAVHITSTERFPDAKSLDFGKELFLGGAIFKEDVLFRGTRICPYVLILDGWDEITVGASEGYQQRVEKMLQAVRRRYLDQRAFPIRVILAGRPTHALEASKFLYGETSLLTVRDLSPAQLESFVHRVKAATSVAEDASHWSLAKVIALPSVLRKYRDAHEAAQEGRSPGTGSLEILGLPLLALLALRLLAARPEDSKEILANTTNLYRSLVDMVVGQAAKPEGAAVQGSAMIAGRTLRQLLRGTAEAMTALGAETIPHDELLVRLDLEKEDLGLQVDELAKEALSRLMISFFFRGGRTELGVEFSHKSFREYLFAEQVVAALKDYGSKAPDSLPERQELWKDFDDGDERKALCHRLAELLGPSWVTREVALHLRQLLAWEISRAAETELPSWRRIRDGLADAWDWWAEGVHQRPQPIKKDGQWEYTGKPLALEIAERMRFRSERKSRPVPPQTTTVDAHLGDGIFRLAATVHAELALRDGWQIGETSSEDWERVAPEERRRYQLILLAGDSRLAFFAPRGAKQEDLFLHCARINAGGLRPMGPFPAEADLRRADLSLADLSGAYLSGADLSGAYLSGADLRGADLRGADLRLADLRRADLRGADLRGADLRGADLRGADLRGADLRGADLRGADLRGAYLSGADLSGADLSGADLSGADLRGADLRDSIRDGALIDPEQLKLAILK